MQCLVDAIVDAKRLPALRSLNLGKLSEWRCYDTTTGEIRLAELGARPASHADARRRDREHRRPLALPQLADLRITCNHLREHDIEQLAAMRCPKLKSIRIAFGHASMEPERIAALLRSRLPHVRKVSVTRPSDLQW